MQASESSNEDHGSDGDCKPLGKKSEPRNHSATRTPTKPVAPHHVCAAFRFDFLHGRCSLDRVSTTSRIWMTQPIDLHLAGVFEGASYSEEGNKTTSSSFAIARSDSSLPSAWAMHLRLHRRRTSTNDEIVERWKRAYARFSQQITTSVEALYHRDGKIEDAKQIQLWERISKVRAISRFDGPFSDEWVSKELSTNA